MLGGGMRQAGILAAAGLHALDHNVDRLRDDHDNARRLAAGLRSLGATVEPEPETNIVLFRVPAASAVLAGARERSVLFNRVGEDAFRAVTHLDVSADDVGDALERLHPVLEGAVRGARRGA
jgi:threonine aldolase